MPNTITYAFDTNRNLTSDGSNSYYYDVENRLIAATVGGSYTTLRYDPLGRLYEINNGATGITRFLNDGADLVGEYNGSGTLLRRYVHGEGADSPLVWFEGSTVADSARRYLYSDERGSVVAVTDSNGNVLDVNSYDEHGIPGSTNQGRFQYTGQAWLPELGMYYYKARMYSPTLGRFMQTDPIGYGDGMNMYGYVHGDPVNGTDPSGQIEIGGLGGGSGGSNEGGWGQCASSHLLAGCPPEAGPPTGWVWYHGIGSICAHADDTSDRFPCPTNTSAIADWMAQNGGAVGRNGLSGQTSGGGNNGPQKLDPSCDTPFFRTVLNNSKVESQIAAAIQQGLHTENWGGSPPSETAFWYGYSVSRLSP